MELVGEKAAREEFQEIRSMLYTLNSHTLSCVNHKARGNIF